uniref:Cytochrome P450 n=1 Tax=Phanerodontia chrysosporium TaxID=2822231 RepID=G5EJP6_PHACH|nr:cytochrome P450 [Phanerodontia chrysosporium]
MSDLITAHVLLPSLAACIYFYHCEPRGHQVALAALGTFCLLVVQDYACTGQVILAIVHALVIQAKQIVLIILATVSYRLSPLHPLARYPGPVLDKSTSLRLAYLAFIGQRAQYVTELHERYGRIVRIGPNKLSINSLDVVHPIYGSSQAYDKSESYRPGLSAEGSIFFARKKAEHARIKRIWSGGFTSAAIRQWEGTIKTRVAELIECVARRRDSRGAVNLSECIQHWSFDFTGEWVLGQGTHHVELMRDGDPEGVVESGHKAIVMFETFGEVPALFDILSVLPTGRAYQLVEKRAATHLRERIKVHPHDGWDMRSFFLAQRDGHNYPPMNEVDLNANTVVAFEAGGDTTAGFIIITMFHLLRYRQAYDKLKEELDGAFPTGSVSVEEYSHLAELPYLSAVINEGLRLGAAFPSFPRVVPKGGAMLAGEFVPEGTMVGVPIYTQHYSPDNFWPEPREFRPERWFKDGLGPGTITRQAAFMPFQSGPFGCPGKALGLRLMSVVISTLVLSYDLSFPPDFDPEAFLDGWINTRTNIFRISLRVEAKRRPW